MAKKDKINFDDDSNSDAFRQFKEMIDRLFGGQFGQDLRPFMNFFNNPDIIKKLQEEGRVDLGFSLTSDENGNINISSFNPGMTFPHQINNTNLPKEDHFFDVIEDGENIIVVGDVSGYHKENIHIGSKGNTKLIIKCSSEDKSFTKELDLPQFDNKSVKVKIKNGSIEISMKTIRVNEDIGHKIIVE